MPKNTNTFNTGDSRIQEIAPWKMRTTLGVVIGFVVALFFFGWVIAADNHEYALTVAIILAGGALGWVIGIFISPMPDEKDQFQSYAKATAAGISGYALAKIDPLLTSLLKPEPAMALENSFRFLAFMVAFIVAMLAAFGWRRYT
ncbi:hypothetical protein [Methyloradius palustris]|uniref:Uncharacterized protein n=1 Tax=Methyloradius palustris TaxID=2778876 RepID=A0A8E3ZI61_9PROT|nr:hypothetical protein [Methyloradius palustris]BCM26195.1 hypothetical protein ZMTM_24540 [Methyloradius palustris]